MTPTDVHSSETAQGDEVVRKVYVRDLRDRQPIQTVFKVTRKARATARSGKVFLVVGLGDRTGEVDARVFDHVDAIEPTFQTGDLVLEVLVPNNKTAPSPLQITETSPALVTLTATQHAGTWTSGNLDTFLGISASPNNPIGAFLPTTQGLDPGATGFNVFTADFGTLFIAGNPPEAQTPLFNVIGGLPVGSYIVAFCESGCTTPPDVATANSGALLVDAPPRVPEPSSLLLLSAGLAGCAAFRRRRR